MMRPGISSEDTSRLVDLAGVILDKWRGYTDADAYIYAETDGQPHNTITPIARKNGKMFELDLVLRNNIMTDERPAGLYHPRNEYHHIKRENIGLIEVMGLAVLPARLKPELAELSDAIINGKDLTSTPTLAIHADWARQVIENHPEMTAENTLSILEYETGVIFSKCLEDAGVYARNDAGKEAFLKFVSYVNS